MPETRLPIPLNVRGDLDTANPVTDRAPGSLIAAADVHPRTWGPREGSKKFTGIWEGPGTASLYDGVTFTGAASQLAEGRSFEEQFGDLGTKFTLDLWFRLEATAYAAGIAKIAVFEFLENTSASRISVSIWGPSETDHEKLYVAVKTSASRTTSDTLVAITGGTRLSVGTAQTDKQHVRLVRDGATMTLFLNGQSDGVSTSLSATHGILRPVGDKAFWFAGFTQDAGATFKGRWYGAVLRDGAFNANPVEATMPSDPFAKNVHLYALGRNYALGGDAHLMDLSRFGAHGRVNGSPTFASSNDDTFPAPARIQGLRSWTDRNNRTVSTVAAGGQLSSVIVS